MVRPRKIKFVGFEPGVDYFKPRAVPLKDLEEVKLTVDELETLRLANIEKLSQTDAAAKMQVHQSTFQRTLTRAREKITDALVNGKAIKISGGEYKMPGRDTKQGRLSGFRAAGPGGVCKCLNCGHEQVHIRGQPCNQIKCSECKIMLTRK